MRINKYVAQATGMSRRRADEVIASGQVTVNGTVATNGTDVAAQDIVTYKDKVITLTEATTLILNKPAGYVCSRDGQGSRTVYDLLPEQYHHLKPVGRLDKDSSGLLLLTNDGELAHQLTHPSFEKEKRYEVQLDKSLNESDLKAITQTGVELEDGVSKLGLESINDQGNKWYVSMHEGRNRQIRRTFEVLDYHVQALHRTHFGSYSLHGLAIGKYEVVRDDIAK